MSDFDSLFARGDAYKAERQQAKRKKHYDPNCEEGTFRDLGVKERKQRRESREEREDRQERARQRAAEVRSGIESWGGDMPDFETRTGISKATMRGQEYGEVQHHSKRGVLIIKGGISDETNIRYQGKNVKVKDLKAAGWQSDMQVYTDKNGKRASVLTQGDALWVPSYTAGREDGGMESIGERDRLDAEHIAKVVRQRGKEGKHAEANACSCENLGQLKPINIGGGTPGNGPSKGGNPGGGCGCPGSPGGPSR